MYDEKNIKLMLRYVFKMIIVCIVSYLAIVNIHHIFNGIMLLFDHLFPFILGLIIAVILNIPLNMIEKKLTVRKESQKRIISIILTLLSTFGLIVCIFSLIIPEFIHGIRMIIELVYETLNQLTLVQDTNGITHLLNQLDIDWISLKTNIESWIQSSGYLMDYIFSIVKIIMSNITNFFIALVFSIYLLANKEGHIKQVKRLLRAWCPLRLYRFIEYVVHVSIKSFQSFIVGQVSEALVLGTLCGIGMAILQIPYVLVISIFIGVSALIPYFGAFLGVIVGFVLIVVVDPLKAIIFIVYILIIQQIEGNMIYPRVVGNKVKLPPIWVFFAVTFGGSVASVAGMFFGVPIASLIYTLIKEITIYKENYKKVGIDV